jgi:hypothetical protein
LIFFKVIITFNNLPPVNGVIIGNSDHRNYLCGKLSSKSAAKFVVLVYFQRSLEFTAMPTLSSVLRFSSSRVYSYLQRITKLLFGGSGVSTGARNRLSYLQRTSKPSSQRSRITGEAKNGCPYPPEVSECPIQQSGLRNCVGDKLRRRGPPIMFARFRLSSEDNFSDRRSYTLSTLFSKVRKGEYKRRTDKQAGG